MLKISLHKVDFNKAFHFENDKSAHTISELSSIIEKIDDSTLEKYFSTEKNDFANWIEFVFEEKELANKLKSIKTKEQLIKTLDEFLQKTITKTQNIKEKHNKEHHATQKKEQKELKEDLKKLQKELTKKLKENNEENILRKHIVVWLILAFIIGIIVGILLTKIIF